MIFILISNVLGLTCVVANNLKRQKHIEKLLCNRKKKFRNSENFEQGSQNKKEITSIS